MKMTHKQKRNRLPNFTPAEESCLLSLARKYVNVIESKLTDAQIWEEKRKAWENIDIEFGNKFGFRRGSKNLREKYDNFKRKLRRMESKDRNDDEPTFQKLFDENIEKLSAIVGFSADCSSNDVENNDTFENGPEMNNIFNDTAQNCSFDYPIQDSEIVEKEGENKWLSSNSNHSAQTRKIKSSRRSNRKPCYKVNDLRSAEKHRWDCKRNKREAEKHRWEFEKHKLNVEKQKWELKEARLKAKLLQLKLKNSIPRDDSKSCIGARSEDCFQTKPHSHIRMQDSTNVQSVDEAQNSVNIATLSTDVKVEPTLDIMDIGNESTINSNENCASNSQVEERNGTTKTHSEELGGMCKRVKTMPSVPSDEQQQWELALKHDMPDTSNGTHSSFLDPIKLVETNISSYIGDDDDNEDDGCQTSEESIPLDATTDDQTKVSTHDNDFLKLLNKHRLQHYWSKLKEINIGLDYLQYIEEVDVRDICGRDIGARIRFRGLLEDWRTSHSLSETITSPITILKEAKRVIAELKAIIKQAPFVKDQNSAITSKESQCSQHTNYKKVLPETPFQSVLDFKVFEELIKNSEEAYQNLITELTAQHIYNSVSFLKTSWRRIMSDHVAQHFCWTGTLEKPAIRTLSVTKALKEAYQRKFDFCTNDDFQRTIQPFFQHAKTRLQKKQNYEKLKAANITL